MSAYSDLDIERQQAEDDELYAFLDLTTCPFCGADLLDHDEPCGCCNREVYYS